MVQRYELSEEWGEPVMSEYDHGEWVKYEDYENLQREHQKLLDAVIQYGHDPETLMELFKV